MGLDDVAAHAATLDRVREKGHEGRRAWYVEDRLVARQEDADTLLIRSDVEAIRDAITAAWELQRR